MATWEHLAWPATSFQTLPGGPQKLRLNPSFSQFSPCPARCAVCPSVCRFHSYCCLPVKGYAVDLAKVLGVHYSSDVEAKQSQDLGDLFQLSIRVPKPSKAITNHGDWVIAFGKTIQAISFALPGRNSEYVAYQAYMSALFTSIAPQFHSPVIDLDKAIRLRAANQKQIRLSEFAMFDDLRTIHLSSFGVGPSARDTDQGTSKRHARAALPGGRESCHNWN